MEEKVFISNNKGFELATIIDRPQKSEPLPVVILLFGFLGYKEHMRGELLAKFLTEKGIAVVRFDPSGFGESKGTLDRDYRFSNYVSDAQSVFDYVVGQSWVDKKKVGIFGESMGGIQAIILARNNQTSVKGMVLVSSPIIMGSDDDLKGKYKTWEKDGYLERNSSKYGTLKIPFAFIEEARHWDALDYLKDMKLPTLVMWGTKDVNVPPKVTRELFDKVEGPKEFRILEGADHFLNRDPKMIEVMAKNSTEFLSARLI